MKRRITKKYRNKYSLFEGDIENGWWMMHLNSIKDIKKNIRAVSNNGNYLKRELKKYKKHPEYRKKREREMERFASFTDLASSVEPFNPPYTKDFRKVVENSIMESRINEARAIESASKIIIT